MNNKVFKLLLGSFLVMSSLAVQAHVKWFVSTDVSKTPRDWLKIFTSEMFLIIGLISIIVMFLSVFIDRKLLLNKSRIFNHFLKYDTFYEHKTFLILRVGVFLFFTAVSYYGEFFLTPELKHSLVWVPYFQFSIAILALFAQTAIFSGLGIILLYGMCITQYGIFHMIDYPIFIGVALYLIICSIDIKNEAKAFLILRVLVGITLIIGGGEKFEYPEWSFHLLTSRPEIAFHLSPELYMLGAGFVEVCTAFFLIFGRLTSRVSALVLLIIFNAAVIPFGMIDAVGHSAIIIVLFVMMFRENPIALRLESTIPNIIHFATIVTLMYVLALFLSIAGYFKIQEKLGKYTPVEQHLSIGNQNYIDKCHNHHAEHSH